MRMRMVCLQERVPKINVGCFFFCWFEIRANSLPECFFFPLHKEHERHSIPNHDTQHKCCIAGEMNVMM